MPWKSIVLTGMASNGQPAIKRGSAFLMKNERFAKKLLG
jgi:hypothetical protein